MEERLKEIVEQIEHRQDELLHLLKTLISFKTPAPPARNTLEAQSFIANFLKKLDFNIDMWDVYPNDPNVVGVLKGSAPDTHNSLIINGHIDVAEVNEDEQWETDPFTPIVKEESIIGRAQLI